MNPSRPLFRRLIILLVAALGASAGGAASLPAFPGAEGFGATTPGGRIINSQAEVGGWPELKSGPLPADTDDDGIPDAWETAHGLNPKDPADANTVNPKTGYTNIEDYLNSLVSG